MRKVVLFVIVYAAKQAICVGLLVRFLNVEQLTLNIWTASLF